MGNIEYHATHGTVLDLHFRNDLAKGVLATNNRALLFRTLHALAKLRECSAICWGLEQTSRSRVFIFVDWKGPAASTGRPALPLGALGRVLSGAPHIHDVILPGSLRALGSSTTMRFCLLRSDATRELAQYTDAALDDQTWQANLKADSHYFLASFPSHGPSPWANHPRAPTKDEREGPPSSMDVELPGFEYLTVAPVPLAMPREDAFPRKVEEAASVFETGDDWVMV
ncbi:unnamed protein product [Zymoseptoria tritici ST99CH_3D7]|uniref:Uncharacterized protein n=1 Tax=Zymoseptoria tritici (strain ST99CH_3D7) TaxID=1276538 RepID=A0A1X7REF4_ZYMT9|nr:unnamed protein product [Zymoseptoria tritici ST99CH_3D7]